MPTLTDFGPAHHAHTHEVIAYGIAAEFESADELLLAAEKASDAGYVFDCYSPFPVHGLPEAMKYRDVRVPWMIFFGGAAGGCAGLALESWVNLVAYPLNVGGKPLFSWPAFIPVTYECTILLAGISAVFGTLALCGFPQPYHPIFNAENFERASQDRFFICLEASTPNFDLKDARKLLDSCKPVNVSVVNSDDEEGGY